MAIQRWDPMRELIDLRERVTQLIDEVLSRSAGADAPDTPAAAGWKPPVDLFEEPTRYVLRADLPGVAAADLEIQVENGALNLRGERRCDSAVAGDAYLRVERPHGRFALQVALPDSIDRSAIKALHANGVVEIVLPKRKAEAPSRIEIAAS
jgi:HSP20 family protein